ncbi:MAG: hypothetical protein QXD48_02080 [Candidatus Aenigmatarchaeota archaeon]
MKTAHIVKSPIGIFAFSKNGELIYYKLFNKNPEKAIIEMEKIPKEFFDMLKDYEIIEDEEAKIILRKNIREFAKSLRFSENDNDFNKFIVEFSLILSEKRLKGVIGRDKLIIQAFNALKDLNKISNLLEERLYEWFSLHYPELKQRNIAKLVVEYGRRENFPDFKSSVGIELNEEDENILREYAKFVNDAANKKKNLERYIIKTIKEIMPNFSSLIDPLLAANFLSLSGSLEKLARMPASTLQLLGAEKALFRHLHKKGKSPKYGILYNSPLIQNAPKEFRGKVARILSSKLMLAARIDFYSGRFEPRLKKELEDELNKVKI